MISEGPSNCIKCNSYRLYKGECQYCGTNQKKWYKENMISNLKQYGFKKSFFSNKWTLGDLVVKPYKDDVSFGSSPKGYGFGIWIGNKVRNGGILSNNMVIEIDGDLKLINQYGDYKSFERFMDNLIGKNNKRNLIIEKILN